MASTRSHIIQISERLLRWRWLVMALTGLIILLFEATEHAEHSHPLGIDFTREILVFGVIVPLLGGAILTSLVRAESERVRANRHLDQQRVLNQQLISSMQWDELARVLVRFPNTFVPLAGASLLTYDPTRRSLEMVADWCDRNGNGPTTTGSSQAPDFCRACASAEPVSLHSVVQCQRLASFRTPEQRNSYCMQLRHDNVLLALLHLHLSPGVSLAANQINMLSSVAPLMALALDNIGPQRSASIQAAATEAERRRIARQLHDSLGQTLAYLRFKLDQLADEDVAEGIAAVHREVEGLRDVANEAYEQVRGTLTALRPDHSIDLATALLALADSVGHRANIRVELSSEGRVRLLPVPVQRQILAIFQEALINVVKHANARQVVIKLIWEEDALTVDFADDGCGFEPGVILSNGHFGLTIMRGRAAEINGCLTFRSRPDTGTELTLRLPLGSGLYAHAIDSRAIYGQSIAC